MVEAFYFITIKVKFLSTDFNFLLYDNVPTNCLTADELFENQKTVLKKKADIVF